MTKKTSSIEVKRVGKKLKMYAMGRTARGTKYIVKAIDMKTLPGTLIPDKRAFPAEIAEVMSKPTV